MEVCLWTCLKWDLPKEPAKTGGAITQPGISCGSDRTANLKERPLDYTRASETVKKVFNQVAIPAA